VSAVERIRGGSERSSPAAIAAGDVRPPGVPLTRTAGSTMAARVNRRARRCRWKGAKAGEPVKTCAAIQLGDPSASPLRVLVLDPLQLASLRSGEHRGSGVAW